MQICSYLLCETAYHLYQYLHGPIMGGRAISPLTQFFLDTHGHHLTGIRGDFALSGFFSLVAVFLFCIAYRDKDFRFSFLIGFLLVWFLFVGYILFMLFAGAVSFYTLLSMMNPPHTFLNELFAILPYMLFLCCLGFAAVFVRRRKQTVGN